MHWLVFFIKHETRWSIQSQAEDLLTVFLMAEPMFFAINLDEFWLVMKGYSNLV